MRIALRWFGVLTLGALLAIAALYLVMRQSLPRTAGELSLAGPAAPIEILRDSFGVPHIYAQSQEDAQFGLGYVHAQDRLWQMEMSRRIGSGRIAELVGTAGLETDRFLRTLGLRRVAEANLRHYDDESRRLLERYVAGVNAYISSTTILPPEFWLLRVRPEPWTALDTIVWLKVMAWDVGANWRNEILRLRLSSSLPLARLHEFLPPYPGDSAPEMRDLKGLYAAMERKPGSSPVFSALPGEAGGASNSWVLGGSRSASGKPLLANDPHLGLSSPAVWYFAHLHAPGVDAIGATLPGVPGILIGRNQRIAWGMTTTGADVQDLYVERLDAAFDTREETISVRGAPDERLTVRVSKHGPVISDVLRAALEATPRGHALALSWTALAEDDLTLQAGLRIATAHDWRSFLAAARDLHSPPQTLTYADADGNIGLIAAGRVPVRKPANDLHGLAPAPGWEARYDWAGTIPFDELPRSFNPASAAIVTANHKIVPAGYKHHITSEWQAPFRARRIEELLGEVPQHSTPTFSRMQLDVASLPMRELLPRLLAVPGKSAEAQDAIKRLTGWDGGMAADRPEPLIAVAWWRELSRAVYADELGPAFRAGWSERAIFLSNTLFNRNGQARWCDNVRTRNVESCDELIAASLERALAELRRRHGADVSVWRWGEAHEARQRHRPFSHSRWLSRIFDIRVPSPGDSYTVNVGRMDFTDETEPYANRHAASLRLLVDLAEPQAALFIHPGGQSGNPFSKHFRDFAEPWMRGEYVPMITERARLEQAGAQRLVLTPRK
jgi:penicillin amidase